MELGQLRHVVDNAERKKTASFPRLSQCFWATYVVKRLSRHKRAHDIAYINFLCPTARRIYSTVRLTTVVAVDKLMYTRFEIRTNVRGTIYADLDEPKVEQQNS